MSEPMIDQMEKQADELAAALDELKNQVAELRVAMRMREGRGDFSEPSEPWFKACEQELSEAMEARESTAAIAAWRVVFLRNTGGQAINTSHKIWTGSIPFDPKQILDRIAPLNNRLALRAMHRLISCQLEGKKMSLSKTQLATDLQVEEAELKETLRPLVKDGTLTRRLSDDDEEIYEVDRAEFFVTLLGLDG